MTTSATPRPAALEAWHRIIEANAPNATPNALAALLADDAVFHSPVVHTPQMGKPIVLAYLTAAAGVLNNGTFTYAREIIGETDAVLEFEGEVDGIHINGVDIIRWNVDDKIDDFKVMIRPLKAVNLIHKKMGEMLAAMKQG